ncbi:SpoIIE family protein phosphatase [Actinacidiphila glaucinigra]|uniref:PAS domain S-box-containing protein n=1 Tax=Actinacidiphila glaucinigra TaxID=235986 RepID=A0A239MS81_9ACTN|nr:SpoIIE family protein phosphatase [Actinacidiphila glaucinigra]SNT45320.1 PAS domain S-box-containing protein [Actinacidiphila glaucinigra]
MPSGEALALVDEAGQVIEWERAAEELFGRSATETIGRSVTALMHEFSTDEGGRHGGVAEAATVVVKPVMQGTAVVWRVLAAGHPSTARDTAILTAVFDHLPVALYILDEQLRIVRTSAVAETTSDTSTESLPGGTFPEVWALRGAEEETAVARRVLESGEAVVNRLVRRRHPSGPPDYRIYAVSYFRLEDSSGSVQGLVACTLDVTEREKASEHRALLERVRANVGHRLSVMDVSWELVEAVVPAFAGTAAVEVVAEVVRGQDPPRTPVKKVVSLHQAAIRGRISASGTVHSLPAGTHTARILSDPQARLMSVEEACAWAEPEQADEIRRSGAHSLIMAPLIVRGQLLGMVSFFRHEGEAPFDEGDLDTASAIGAHASLCIDNARRYMREWIIASTIQSRILPPQPDTQATLEVRHLHLPGIEGGGAWSDAIALPSARTALIVGDVAGKGIPAAITMGLLRTAIHTLTALDLQPDELLARLSDTTARLVAARAALPPVDPLHREPLTASCAIVIYDPVDLTCTTACAGLPESFAIFPDSTSTGLLAQSGPQLAARDTAPIPATTTALPVGSTIVMSTTAEASTSAGSLRPLLESAGAGPLVALSDALAQELGDGPLPAETAMLLARTKALPADQVLTLALPEGPDAAPIARAAARRQLEVWDLDAEIVYTSELIISEFVGNAIRYGSPPLRLRLILDQTLTCEVSDGAPSSPHVRHARTLDETGRGLFIIASLADRWGTRYHADGKSVWAEQSVNGASGLPS